MTPAAELRTAASKLRELAQRATPRRAARPRESGCAVTPGPHHTTARKHRNQLWERRK